MFMKYFLTGTVATRFLWHLRKNQWKPLRELKSLQLKRLKAMVHHAYNHVPYYHHLFKSAEFKPEDVESFKDLQRIPITTKMDVQRNPANIITVGVDTSKCTEYFTTGSTGIPLKTYKDLGAASKDTALKAYAFLECGVRLTDRFVSVAWRQRSMILPSQIWIPSRVYKTDAITDYLRRIKPDIIYAYPSFLEELCSSDTSGISPRLIFTQAANLTQHCRSLVRSTFSLEIYDTYGSTELGRLAFECNEHSGLHILTDSGVMEFVDDDGEPVAPGEIGEIVVTGLYNYAMPLIRYNVGDLGTLADGKCSCGRSWPLIKSIEGRSNDVIVMPSGRKIYPSFFLLGIENEIEENPFCISQYQMIQEKRNRIILKLVPGKEFDQRVVSRIKQNFQNLFIRLDEDIHVDLRCVEKIPLERTGKRRKVISLVG